MAGAYNGWLVTGSVKGWVPIAPKFDLGMGASTTYGSASYMDTYFGVDAEDAQRSGLSQFSPSSGFRDVSLLPSVVYHLNRSWSLGAGLRYMRLIQGAYDSPVTDVGNPDQYIVGLGVLYKW